MKQVYTTLNQDTLQNLLQDPTYKVIILKFSATWCKPCQKIKNSVDKLIQPIPEDGLVFYLDIDDDMNNGLYSKFKTYRMIKGVPGILVYYHNPSRDQWYVPDIVVNNSNLDSITQLFNNIYNTLNMSNNV